MHSAHHLNATDLDEITTRGWGNLHLPHGSPERVSLPELTLMTDFVAGGGGYGDPLGRPPEAVARDVRNGATSVEIARRIYGVIVDEKTFSLNAAEVKFPAPAKTDAPPRPSKMMNLL